MNTEEARDLNHGGTGGMTPRPAGMEHHPPAARETNGVGKLAQGLGWFSIGLGVAEMAAPRVLARAIGVRDERRTRILLRSMGAREFATGVGILTRTRPVTWVWARVAGDAVDLALLGQAARSRHTERNRVAAAAAAVLGVSALDVLASRKLHRDAPITDATDVRAAITINRAPDEVYRFWRELQDLPRFMDHLESVHVLDERRSRWRTKAIAGAALEWESEIVEDRPHERLAWRSTSGDVEHEGSVTFTPAPGGRGTEVRLYLRYQPPGGVLGKALASLAGRVTATKLSNDLRRLKQIIETGEIVRSDASVHTGPHPAQPSRTGGAA